MQSAQTRNGPIPNSRPESRPLGCPVPSPQSPGVPNPQSPGVPNPQSPGVPFAISQTRHQASASPGSSAHQFPHRGPGSVMSGPSVFADHRAVAGAPSTDTFPRIDRFEQRDRWVFRSGDSWSQRASALAAEMGCHMRLEAHWRRRVGSLFSTLERRTSSSPRREVRTDRP
jgi:hypothetical protein